MLLITNRFALAFVFLLLVGNIENSQANHIDSDEVRLQTMINSSVKDKVPLKLELNKRYVISKPLVLPSGLVLEGNGAIIAASADWPNINETYSSMFNVVQAKNVKIRNLTIDMKGHQRLSKSVFSAILMLGAESCYFYGINFLNGGIQPSEKYLPNSPFVLILSQDQPGEFSYVVKRYRGIIAASSSNVFESCVFDNSKSSAGFGIRILSNWTKRKTLSQYKYTTSNNQILSCTFKGNFEWNTIEIAGGGTTKNIVSNNMISGRSINNIDLDKGASDNVVTSNYLTNVGLPKRFSFNNDVRCSPIMVHGIQGSSGGKNYYAKNNVVEYNHIDGINNPDKGSSRFLYSSAIGASDVDGLIIRGNVIKNVYSQKSYGGAIVLDQICSNIEITGNEISNCNWGIVFTANGKILDNVQIYDNKLTCNREALYLLSGQKSTANKISVYRNNIFLSMKFDRSRPAILVGKNAKTVMISDNTINGNYSKDKSISAPAFQSTIKSNLLN